jgi:hypothetical protein
MKNVILVGSFYHKNFLFVVFFPVSVKVTEYKVKDIKDGNVTESQPNYECFTQ